MTVLLVALFGGLGAVGRFAIDTVVPRRPDGFPWAIFGINVGGSLLLGLLAGAVVGSDRGPLYAAATTGLCGGFTTFSTAMADTIRLAQQGQRKKAAANATSTLAATVLAAAVGFSVAS